MLAFIGGIVSYLLKNMSLVIGILEAILKAFGGIVSLTPTKADDKIYAFIDKWFTLIKKWLYTYSDKIAGKEIVK